MTLRKLDADYRLRQAVIQGVLVTPQLRFNLSTELLYQD